MVILADFSDTQLQMTCKRCEQTLQEGDRFCRYCGQDQMEGDPSAVIDITQPASNGNDLAPTPWATQRAARRDAWRQSLSPQDTAPQNGAADGRPGGTVAPRRWSVGLAAVVLIALAVALLHDLYRSRQEEAMRGETSAQRERQSAGAVQEQAAPASPDTAAAAPETPAAPLAAEGGGAPSGRPASDTPAVSAVVAPPASEAPAPVAAAPPAPSAAPATEPDAAPPAAPSRSAAPSAAEPPSQGACPEALAAMALCVNR